MKKFIFFVAITVAAYSCSKKTDTVATAQLSDYLPLQPGKYIRYRFDSMRFVGLGQRDTIVSYDAKDVIDAEITDNQGRKAYRVVRYLRDYGSTNDADYHAMLTYSVTSNKRKYRSF